MQVLTCDRDSLILHRWQVWGTRGVLRAERCSCGVSRVVAPGRTWVFNTAHLNPQSVARYRRLQCLKRT